MNNTQSAIRNNLTAQVIVAIERAQAAGALPPFEIPTADLIIEQPREAAFGDYASPAPLKLARLAHIAPLKIAQATVAHLPALPYLEGVTADPPGFINFRLSKGFLQQLVEAIVVAGPAFGQLNLGLGQRAQVEFVSANPTGPLTVGRSRGGVMGDTLARALAAAGYDVTREYYYNDAGRQIEMLGESVQIRY
ncbi:MAG: arginine--tRNA ligase, partial [Chloroflexota bacterium]